MNPRISTQFESLPHDLAERIEPICRDFERHWQTNLPIPIEDYLARVEPEDRSALLWHLLGIELHYASKREDPLSEAAYSHRFPDHPDLVEAAFEAYFPSHESENPYADETVSAERFREKRSLGEATMPTVPGYEIIEELDEGGMGRVYAARDVGLHRRVAVKVIRQEFLNREQAHERFLCEARAAASLNHDHIVTVYQVGECDSGPFLAMEFLEGETLKERLAREGRLSVAETVRIGRELAEGLTAAHAVNLVHRDIKPGNVWLQGVRSRVKILDFGLARTIEAGPGLTDPGMVVGTAAYMSPEQANSQPVGLTSDLFSLGTVLYEMATGLRAFPGAGLTEVLRKVAEHHPRTAHEINPDLPIELGELMGRLMAKAPADRPQSAREVADALMRIGNSLRETVDVPSTEPLSSPSTTGYRTPRWRVRRLLLGAGMLSLLGVGLMLSSMGGLFDFFPGREDTRPAVETPQGPLEGELTAYIWTAETDTRKRGLDVKMDPRALPAREGEALQLQVELDRPAYVYLLWVDPKGVVTPLYPWNDNDEGKLAHQSVDVLPPPQEPTQRFTSPRRLDQGWRFDNTAGLDTVIMLATSEPLSADYPWAERFGELPAAPFDPSKPDEVVIRGWREGRELGRWEQSRSPTNAVRINNQLLDLVDRLRDDFELIRTIQFAHAPKAKE